MSRYRNDDDTICALSTPPGTGGIGVVRVSGKNSFAFVKELATFLPERPESHRVYYGFLKGPLNQKTIDEVLISFFAEGRSFTGENTFEISFHGSPLIADQILRELVVAGARPAEPGEFTYRAFVNGRLDLAQAEAVLSLIESRSERSRQLALKQLRGSLSRALQEFESELIKSLANLEANLDFSQEDIEFAKPSEIVHGLKAIQSGLEGLIQTHGAGQVAQSGYRVVLVGSPNVGKSSLLNRILEEDRAIVTDVPGTTRDLVSGEKSIGPYQVTFVDSAGLRQTDDLVESLGIERTKQAVKEADLVFFVDDVSQPQEVPDFLAGADVVRVRNKSDLMPAMAESRDSGPIFVSALSGFGVSELLQQVSSRLAQFGDGSGEVILQSRQFDLLSRAKEALGKGILLAESGASPEFVISEIQDTLFCVMEVLGKRFDDEVMDQVFRQFCLGK